MHPSFYVVCINIGPVRVEEEKRNTEMILTREGCPRQLQLQLLSLDVLRWKKYLVHQAKKSTSYAIHRVGCPVNT